MSVQRLGRNELLPAGTAADFAKAIGVESIEDLKLATDEQLSEFQRRVAEFLVADGLRRLRSRRHTLRSLSVVAVAREARLPILIVQRFGHRQIAEAREQSYRLPPAVRVQVREWLSTATRDDSSIRRAAAALGMQPRHIRAAFSLAEYQELRDEVSCARINRAIQEIWAGQPPPRKPAARREVARRAGTSLMDVQRFADDLRPLPRNAAAPRMPPLVRTDLIKRVSSFLASAEVGDVNGELVARALGTTEARLRRCLGVGVFDELLAAAARPAVETSLQRLRRRMTPNQAITAAMIAEDTRLPISLVRRAGFRPLPRNAAAPRMPLPRNAAAPRMPLPRNAAAPRMPPLVRTDLIKRVSSFLVSAEVGDVNGELVAWALGTTERRLRRCLGVGVFDDLLAAAARPAVESSRQRLRRRMTPNQAITAAMIAEDTRLPISLVRRAGFGARQELAERREVSEIRFLELLEDLGSRSQKERALRALMLESGLPQRRIPMRLRVARIRALAALAPPPPKEPASSAGPDVAFVIRSGILRHMARERIRSDFRDLAWSEIRSEVDAHNIAGSTIEAHYTGFTMAAEVLADRVPDVRLARLEDVQEAWSAWSSTSSRKRVARYSLLRVFRLLSREGGPSAAVAWRIGNWLEDAQVERPRTQREPLSIPEVDQLINLCLALVAAGVEAVERAGSVIDVGATKELYDKFQRWTIGLGCLVAALTGLRRESVAQIGDSDWAHLHADTYGLLWSHKKKTEHSLCLFPGDLAREMNRYAEITRPVREALGTDRLFLIVHRGIWRPMPAQFFSNHLAQLGEGGGLMRDGLPVRLTCTLLRTTYATRRVGEGVSAHALAAQLGHASFRTSLNYVAFEHREHAEAMRGPLAEYGRTVLTPWEYPGTIADLSAEDRLRLIQRGPEADQVVGMCSRDRCVAEDGGRPIPCTLCRHLVVVDEDDLDGWRDEIRRRKTEIRSLESRPDMKPVIANLTSMMAQVRSNLDAVKAQLRADAV